MASEAVPVLLLVFLLGSTFGIKLEGNGYTDVLIAINPVVPENPLLIERIKEMVSNASSVLFTATEDKFYFEEITILVPPNWSQGDYGRTKTETYEKANIVINEGNRAYGDQPYTLQYGQCGSESRYIHLTTKFILDDELIKLYGPRGKVLVHEWAHLRWGVYDEYDAGQPFYKGAHSNIQVTTFCSNKTHNSEAPNAQNRMCDNRDVMDVIFTSSVDAKANVQPLKGPRPAPRFTVIQRGQRVVCLVLDVSGSMGELRKNNGNTMGDEIILLTDGESELDCASEVKESGAIVNTIALGPSANKELKMMSEISGGKYFYASDNLDQTELVNVFASLTTTNGDLTHQTILTGDWTYTIKNTLSDQYITITITSCAVSEAIPPVTVKTHMSQQSIDGSKPMLVYAEVNQKGVPVILADVMATLESDAGDHYQLELLDNGAGADAFRNDGIYSRFFTTSKKGRYNLKVKVQRKDKGKNNGQVRLKRHSVAPYVPGYVIKGKVVMNPPKPPVSEDDLQADVGSFTRTAIGESFSVSLSPGVPPPNFPPNKITDLNAEIEEDKVMLTWTSPGEDMDQGTADSYEIRVSMDLEALRGNFIGAHLMNTSDIRPLEAGSTEEYSFLSSYIINAEPETVMFFAVRSCDKDSLMSDMSNVAKATKNFIRFKCPRQLNPWLNLVCRLPNGSQVIRVPCPRASPLLSPTIFTPVSPQPLSPCFPSAVSHHLHPSLPRAPVPVLPLCCLPPSSPQSPPSPCPRASPLLSPTIFTPVSPQPLSPCFPSAVSHHLHPSLPPAPVQTTL
ncbi:calcium-activated chloride channel regulator 1-like [Salvelinus alpinus]|uniref:calcium-activated chloride channel regulator 1-like n=1 Tax=Salvelinus alpinus TaxID=8036 RepID=UPI0039FD4790